MAWFNNQGIPSASMNVTPEMQQYFSGTDWRSEMQPMNAWGNTQSPSVDYSNYEDLIMNPEHMPNRLQNLERFADNRFEGGDENVPGMGKKAIDFIDQPVQFGMRANHPMKGFLDKNFNYKALNQGTADATANWLNQNQGEGINLSNFFPGKAMYEGIAGMLPKMDPRQVALRNAYGYDNAGRVPQGELMAGYNPVSGGFLNTLTGGKFGKEPTYGLQGAYDKRIGTIDKTLAKWEADEEKYGERLKTTELYARRKALEEAKAAELNMLNKVKADQIAEANAAAAAAKAPTPAFNPQFDKAPPGGGGGGPTWHGATAARQKAGKSVSGPGFGKGAYWAEGGRVGYKTGGRVGILSVF
jgi:hypothetical protein